LAPFLVLCFFCTRLSLTAVFSLFFGAAATSSFFSLFLSDSFGFDSSFGFSASFLSASSFGFSASLFGASSFLFSFAIFSSLV